MPLKAILIAIAIIVSPLGKADQPLMSRNTTPRTGESVGAQSYRDGLYHGTADYDVPYGSIEPMTVSIALTNDTISSSSVKFDTVDFTSRTYQSSFQDVYKTRVLGRKIDDLHLSRMGGASLTTRAFNSALDEIRRDAKQDEV